MPKLNVACIGIGGYARRYLQAMIHLANQERVTLMAVADPRPPETYPETIKQLHADAPILYHDYQEMLREVPDLDLVTICTGLHLHYPMLIQAVEAGCHVILAKPAAVTVQTIDRMIETATRCERIVAVGFQHIYADATQAVKAEIAAGSLGRVKTVVSKHLWQRSDAYYQRNEWAGQLRLHDDYVLDGPLNNAQAHYIMNSLYFAHPERQSYAAPLEVQAELYHARNIPGEDTACLRADLDTGATLYHYSTLCRADSDAISEIMVVAERGTAVWGRTGYTLRWDDGRVTEKSSSEGQTAQTVEHIVDYVQGGEKPPLCTLEDARKHVLVTNGAYESSQPIRRIPPNAIREFGSDGNHVVSIDQIDEIFEQAAGSRKLFSEFDVPWATATRPYPLHKYTHFDLFA